MIFVKWKIFLIYLFKKDMNEVAQRGWSLYTMKLVFAVCECYLILLSWDEMVDSTATLRTQWVSWPEIIESGMWLFWLLKIIDLNDRFNQIFSFYLTTRSIWPNVQPIWPNCADVLNTRLSWLSKYKESGASFYCLYRGKRRGSQFAF
jgi:hypothetical protein